MSEARILAAFYNAKQGRFCELTANDVMDRCRMTVTSYDFKSLVQRRIILRSVIKEWHPIVIYRLAPEGERRVSAMVVLGTLPKRPVRLSAVPPTSRQEAAE